MNREEIRSAATEIVRRSCERQGLPLKITDPVVLQKIATIIRGAFREPRRCSSPDPFR